MYHCSAHIFVLLPISNTEVCEVELSKVDASKALSLCPYKLLVPQSVFHRSFFNHPYLLFTQTYFASVACLEDITCKDVSGHLTVNIKCFVHSNTLKTFQSKLHQGFTQFFTSNVFPLDVLENLNFSSIKYINNSLSELTFSNISELESTVQYSLPVYLHLYVHYPFFIAPIILMIVILIPVCCAVKKALTLYRHLKQTVNTRTNTEDS